MPVPLRPLIAICGTTGVGKSKLAIEIALSLSSQTHGCGHGAYTGARIINADAMQVYAGLDILTNKVPVEEQSGIEHLLMGFKQPGEQYVVGQWVKDAMNLIDDTHRRNQVPIVVGGTAYWIQHLVFPGRLATFDDPSRDSSASSPIGKVSEKIQSEALQLALSSLSPELQAAFDGLPFHIQSDINDPATSLLLHRVLSALDPSVAQRWHWKDSRKVLRSLEIIQSTGRLPSEIISEQSEDSLQPRYRTLCFWLYAQPDALNPRLDARVDTMLEQGLLKEVDDCMKAAASARPPSIPDENAPERGVDMPSTDYTLGIYQSIGYREFSAYLAHNPSLTPPDDDAIFRKAVERMKISTRQYAKRQVSWIRNKLLPAAFATNNVARQDAEKGREVVPAYLLDATQLGDEWTSQVQTMATRITQDFLGNRPLPDPLSLSETARDMLSIAEKPTDPTAVLHARKKVVCPVCTINEARPVMIEDGKEWALHVKTRFHRKLATRDKRREARERWRSQERKKEQDHRQTESEDEHDESTTLFDSDSL